MNLNQPVPECFDDPSVWRADDRLAEFCEDCPIAYQAAMLLERRCFPPMPEQTPVRQLMDAVPDPWQVRLILEVTRVGFPSDKIGRKKYLE